ncbi:MAG: hypothetical protein EBU31_07560 [Proteobacteria bacterium]|nr:hypothetical protein [Pseudomonadota bacterium]
MATPADASPRQDSPAFPSSPSGLPAASPVAIATRNMRLVFLAALACAFVVTHIPRLAVGASDSPVDKLVHATGYGVLAALLLLARWWHPVWPAIAALAAWAALDEVTQAVPGLGRSADLDDWFADVTGMVIAAAFFVAASPVGTGAAKLLCQRRRIAGDTLLCKVTAWFHLATVGVLGFAAGAPMGVLLDSFFVRKGPQPWQYGLIGGVLGAGIGMHALWEYGVRSRLRRLGETRPCIACGSGMDPHAQSCPACGRARAETDWAPVAPLQGSEELAACIMPILLSLAGIVVVSASAIVLITVLRLRSDLVMRGDTWYRMLPPDARVLGDIALVALFGAWGLQRCRARIARSIDRCGERCLGCGYDLHATVPALRAGTCHECGGGFVRVH